MKSFSKIILLIIAAIIAAGPGIALAQDEADTGLESVWLAGKINGGYMDFTDTAAKDSLNGYADKYSGGFDIVTGAKIKKGAFPAIQAGPLDEWGGNKTYPLRLHFKLDAVNPAGYVLTAGLAGSAMLGGGKLELDVNGAKTTEPVQPGINEEALKTKLTSSSASRVIAFIPASKFKAGDNTITLTVTAGSWVIYDYILFEALADAARPVVKDFSAVAPPFLAKDGKGGVGHALSLSYFFAGPADKTSVSISLGGKSVPNTAKINPGMNRATIILPEQKQQATATVSIIAGGATVAETQVDITPVRHLTISLMPHSHLDIGYPDIQPNIVIDQKTYLENALDLIDKKTEVPMKWVVEASWPLYNMLKGKSAYDIYGPWLKNTSLTQTVPEQFWKDTATMRDSAFNASVTSSASPKDALNNRRAVDGSVMGWSTSGAAKGAWIQLDYTTPRTFKYIMLRQGREALNPIKSFNITFTGADGKTNTVTTGPLSVERERLSVDIPNMPVKSLRIEIADVEKPDSPASLMEIETWENESLETQRKRVLKAIKDGRMEVSGLYMNYLTGFIPTEWLIRSMLRSHEIAKMSGVPIRSALITDVPGFSFAMPDVLSGSGVKYFYTGINPDHAPNSLEGMPRAFWWTGPGGGKILVFRSFNDYNEGWRLGFTISADEVEKNLPGFLAGLDEKTYPYDSLPLRTLGDITDDGPVAEKLPDVVAEWNRRWAYPKLEIGLPTKFFESFEKKYASSLPAMQGDWTGFWEDGVGSSALETANARTRGRNTIALEALAAIQDRILGGKKELDTKLSREDDLMHLYYEHTWGADASISAPDSKQTLGQWAFKQLDFNKQRVFSAKSDDLVLHVYPVIMHFAHMMNQFALNPVVLYNPTPFQRKAVVSTNILSAISRNEIQGSAVILNVFNEGVANNDEMESISLPSSGIAFHKMNDIGLLNEQTKDPIGVKTVENVIENEYYKITFGASGTIASIYDKEIGRELLDNEYQHGFGDMFYTKGRPGIGASTKREEGYWQNGCVETESYLNCRTYWDKENINKFDDVTTGVLQMHHHDLERSVTIFKNDKRILIEYYVNKQDTLEKESLYFAFPFNVPDGKMLYEVTGGVMTPEKEQLPGASRDWISVQDGIGVVSDDYSVLMATPDAPLVIPGDIHVLEFTKKNDLKNTTFYSWPMNNYWHTNYKASQGGQFEFRYAITSMKGRAKDSDIIRFGEKCSVPVAAFSCVSTSAEICGSTGEVSFLSFDKANVRMLGLKKAEDGDGLILRLQEMDGADTPVTISLHPELKITKALMTNLVEDNGAPLNVRKGADGRTLVDCKVPAHGYLTVRLK